MEKELLSERVAEILIKLLLVSKEEIAPEASFVDDFGIDSLGIFQLIMEIEDEFGINLSSSDEKVVKIKTIDDLLNAIVSAIQPSTVNLRATQGVDVSAMQ